MDDMQSIARNYLEKNPLDNCDALALLGRAGTRVKYAGADGVVLHYDDFNMIVADGAATERRLLPLLTDDEMIILHSPALLDEMERCGYEVYLPCRTARYERAVPVSYVLPAGAEIRCLARSAYPIVRAHYRHTDDDYLLSRIDAGMYGAFFGETLAGFIGTHIEHSMGLLEILPDYRRMHLAYALEGHLINRLLAAGETPFCEVEIHNDASFALQRKLGLTVSDNVVYWLARRARA